MKYEIVEALQKKASKDMVLKKGDYSQIAKELKLSRARISFVANELGYKIGSKMKKCKCCGSLYIPIDSD